MRLDDGKVLADKLQVLFFSLKVPGRVKRSLKKAANWCKFISGSTNPEVLRELGKDTEWKEEYMTAVEACIKISAEERAWAYHLSVDRAEADYRNEIELNREEARDEGLMEGMKQGENNKALSTARNLLAMGLLTHEQIARATELPLDEVERLAAQAALAQ